jgi:predicted ATP-dependent endonuclease of OLD family
LSATLHIKKFGPIAQAELRLAKINVLIGDQGTGKSTIARLLCLLKRLSSSQFHSGEISTREDKGLDALLRVSLKIYDLSSYLTDSSFISFNCIECQILIENGILSITNKTMAAASNDEQPSNYIVAERNYVSLLSNALFGLNEMGTKLPTLFNKFGNDYAGSRSQGIVKEYRDILGVDFQHLNGTDNILLQNYQTLPLSQGSSGIQGTVPLLVVYDAIVAKQNLAWLSGKKDTGQIVIEEPELNLFPETQYKLVKYLVKHNYADSISHLTAGASQDSNKTTALNITQFQILNELVITTHSPYILSALNNLMYAWQIGVASKFAWTEVDDIIPLDYWLDPSEVSAHMLVFNSNLNGCEAKSIIDESTGLINTIAIDTVSDIISDEFNQIMSIELKK